MQVVDVDDYVGIGDHDEDIQRLLARINSAGVQQHRLPQQQQAGGLPAVACRPFNASELELELTSATFLREEKREEKQVTDEERTFNEHVREAESEEKEDWSIISSISLQNQASDDRLVELACVGKDPDVIALAAQLSKVRTDQSVIKQGIEQLQLHEMAQSERGSLAATHAPSYPTTSPESEDSPKRHEQMTKAKEHNLKKKGIPRNSPRNRSGTQLAQEMLYEIQVSVITASTTASRKRCWNQLIKVTCHPKGSVKTPLRCLLIKSSN